MKGRRKAAEDRTVKRMPCNESVTQHSRRKNMQDLPADAGAMAHLFPGTDVARGDIPAVDNPPNAMIRRQIEMYREAQLLRQHLTDSYDT